MGYDKKEIECGSKVAIMPRYCMILQISDEAPLPWNGTERLHSILQKTYIK